MPMPTDLARRLLLGGAAATLLSGAGPLTGDAAFLAAARSNDVSTLKRMLAAGQSVETRDAVGRTALLVATVANSVDAARLLIAAGADVNAKDGQRDTPYLFAGAEGRVEILWMTLAAGANLKDTNRYGGTALIPAAEKGHLETLAMLLSTSIDIDHVNDLGWTALLEAVILGDGGHAHQEIVRMLLDAGADPTIADNDGVTPLEHARDRSYRAMAELLEQASGRA